MKVALGVLLVTLVAPHGALGHDPTRVPAKPAIEELLPSRAFGKVQDATCVTHRGGLYGFFNGERPGLHDADADVLRVCGGYIATPTSISVYRIDGRLPCGPGRGEIVACGAPLLGMPPQLFLFALELRGPVPLRLPSDRTGRYSLYIDGGGDPSTKAAPTPATPDLASQGTNLTYQLVLNDPGTTAPSSVDVVAFDRRRGSGAFVATRARIWAHQRFVVFVVPGDEIGQLRGVRGGTFFGARQNQDDASRGEQEVTPGGVHAPFGLVPYDHVF